MKYNEEQRINDYIKNNEEQRISDYIKNNEEQRITDYIKNNEEQRISDYIHLWLNKVKLKSAYMYKPSDTSGWSLSYFLVTRMGCYSIPGLQH